jgi:hypothetical protein
MLTGARGKSNPKHPLSLSATIGICFATILPDRQPARRLFSLNFRCETNSFLSCKPLPAQLRAEKEGEKVAAASPPPASALKD